MSEKSKASPSPVPSQASAAPLKTAQNQVVSAGLMSTGLDNQTMQMLLNQGLIQAKLELGNPDDPLEHAAEANAAAVTGTLTNRKRCSCGGIAGSDGLCTNCCKRIQHASEGKSSMGAAPSVVQTALPGSGQNMDMLTRRKMENSMGYDFRDVRIHTDLQAAQSAQAIQARAYTYGKDIVFNQGHYRPGTSEGDQLLAHELSHVIQQEGGAKLVQRSIFSDVVAFFREEQQGGEATSQALFENLSNYSPEERIEMIRRILELFWVDPLAEYALERIWASFGADFLTIAEANLDLWQRSHERGLEITELNIDAVNQKIQGFQSSAVELIRAILDASETQIRREMLRYGLHTEFPDYAAHAMAYGDFDTQIVGVSGRGYRPPEPSYSMQRTPASVGLQAGARQLLLKRRAIRDTEHQQMDLVMTYSRRVGYDDYEPVRRITNQERYDALGLQIEQLRAEYNELRVRLESRYPILSTVNENGVPDMDVLEDIASEGSSDNSSATIRLNEIVNEKLSNINTVRERISDEAEKIWELPRIVEMTQARLGWANNTLNGQIIRAKQGEVEDDETFTGLVLAAVAIGLGLLAALPTGGSSLVAGLAVAGAVGSVGLNSYMAYESIQRYQFESAAAGTDFDKARAVSGSDPSLFWVAVDIVGAGLEIGPALRVFRAAGPTIHSALRASARNADEVTEAVEAAARATGTGEELAVRLAQRISDSVEARRVSAGVANAVDTSIEHVDDAVRAASREIEEGAEFVRRVEDGRHELKLAENGMLVRCSERCELVQLYYAEILSQNSELADELADIQRAARAQQSGWEERAADLLLRLRRQRMGPLESLVNPEQLHFLLRTQFGDDLTEEVVALLARVARDGVYNSSERFGRMVEAIRNMNPEELQRQLRYQVRINVNSGVFHTPQSQYFETMSQFEDISLLEAQIRDYRPSLGANRRLPIAEADRAPGAVLSERLAAPLEGDANIAHHVQQLVGDPQQRRGLEQYFPSRSEYPEGSVERMILGERAHVVGPGTGAESAVGISIASREINQIYQNRGVEDLIRYLHAHRPEGVRYTIQFAVETRPGSLADGRMLQYISYRVGAVNITHEGANIRFTQIGEVFEGTIEQSAQGRAILSAEAQFGAMARYLGPGGLSPEARAIGSSARTAGEIDPALHQIRSAIEQEFSHRTLVGKNFSDARLAAENMREITLESTNLHGARLMGADLRRAIILNCDLRGADLTAADLRGAFLNNVLFDNNTILPNGRRWANPNDMSEFINPNSRFRPTATLRESFRDTP